MQLNQNLSFNNINLSNTFIISDKSHPNIYTFRIQQIIYKLRLSYQLEENLHFKKLHNIYITQIQKKS